MTVLQMINHMQENKLLGALMPSHPDIEPIIQAVREKYKLKVIYLDDDPIEEIILGDEIISFDEFRQDIRNRILEKIEILFPENFVKQYQSAEKACNADFQTELEKYPDEIKPAMEGFFEYVKISSQTVYQLFDTQIDSLTNMLYINLLLGEEADAPEEWFGKVGTMSAGGDEAVFAMAGEVTNLDLLFQQFRELHKKTFKRKQVKISNATVSTAYYLQLTRSKRDKDFILDEYIRRNKFSLPRDKNSARYLQTRNKYAQRLKKRLQRTKKILDVIMGDKK